MANFAKLNSGGRVVYINLDAAYRITGGPNGSTIYYTTGPVIEEVEVRESPEEILSQVGRKFSRG